MNVLYFHQHFSTPLGSTGNRSYAMAQRLLLRGHRVTIACGRYKGAVTGLTMPFISGERRGVVDGIDVVEFDLPYSNNDNFLKRSLIFLKFVMRGSRLVFNVPHDVIFATSTPLTAGIPGMIARWFRRKPFVFEVRDLWPELPKAMGVVTNPVVLWCLSVLEGLTYHSAAMIIGLSPGIVDGIAKRGISRERIKMIPNGCDLSLFQDAHCSPRPAGVSASDFMVIYTGTLGLANGLDAVLDAAGELKRRGRLDIKFVLVGQGKLKPELQGRVQQEQLDAVIFLDPMPKDKLAEFMASADMGMQVLANIPAFYDGTSPNKFFDYISAGLPVLSNYPGWLAEKIIAHDSGFVVPPENASIFADALELAASNKLRINAMGARAMQLAIREFDRTLHADQWVDVLEAAACLSRKSLTNKCM